MLVNLFFLIDYFSSLFCGRFLKENHQLVKSSSGRFVCLLSVFSNLVMTQVYLIALFADFLYAVCL